MMISTKSASQDVHAISDDQPPSSGIPPFTLALEQNPNLEQRIDLNWIRLHLEHALTRVAKLSNRRIGEIEIRVTNDEEMTRLNRLHHQADATTDVLSFDMSEGDPREAIQAEIVVCADVAARQARELNHTIERELLLYCVHGALHCAGFDDHTDDQFNAMHAAEDAILESIGVGATFARDDSSRDGGSAA